MMEPTRLSLRRQGLTILTTEGCNFSCVYCHQPHEPLHMGAATVSSILSFVRRKVGQIDQLDISWFGGEPLLNLRAVRSLSAGFRDICSDAGIGLQGFMSTNAFLLTPDLLAELVDFSIGRYQITFDGPEDVHNRRRLAANGRPTYAKLWEHLMSYRAVDRAFEVLVRVHVMPDSVEDARAFLQTLRGELGDDARFKITVANVSHWGGPRDHAIPVFTDAQPILRSLSAEIGPINRTIESNGACSAASPFDLVIRPDGTVVKCAHSLDLPENQLGHLEHDGRFVYRSGAIDRWLRGIVTGEQRALECPRDGIEEGRSGPLVQLRRGLAKAAQPVR